MKCDDLQMKKLQFMNDNYSSFSHSRSNEIIEINYGETKLSINKSLGRFFSLHVRMRHFGTNANILVLLRPLP